jgi:tRNA threonylcarbamoyladenosine biosynthesis protein TsaB
MALILNIETSTPVCSASIAINGNVIALKESFDDKSHASLLTIFISELLSENQIKWEQIEAVSVSEGPGSYTGLRIGVSVAKGICYAKNIPLIAVNTLQAMALMASHTITDKEVLLCPMIDARRMEVYSAIFNHNTSEYRKISAEIIDENSFVTELSKNKVAFFGNGVDKCKAHLTHKNAIFIESIYPSAKFMAPLAQKAFDSHQFKDAAYFEPLYLKDFVATVSKKELF